MNGAGPLERLEPVVDDLDQLMAELRFGIRGQAHYDALEERAHRISLDVRGAFRSRCNGGGYIGEAGR